MQIDIGYNITLVRLRDMCYVCSTYRVEYVLPAVLLKKRKYVRLRSYVAVCMYLYLCFIIFQLLKQFTLLKILTILKITQSSTQKVAFNACLGGNCAPFSG